jgi:hypothetical protein
MHQHEPSAALLPHWNVAPQRSQASSRNGNERAGIIAALSGVIAGKINHAGMTALRRWAKPWAVTSGAFSSIAAGHGGGGDPYL